MTVNDMNYEQNVPGMYIDINAMSLFKVYLCNIDSETTEI